MLSLERQQALLRHLRSHRTANVTELAEALAVSLSTVRRDLKDMQDRGLLSRVYGGASVLDDDIEEGRGLRIGEHEAEKRRIGQAAAARIPPAATILISGGTTTEAMLPFLMERDDLTVLTNNIGIAYQLARFPSIAVVVLGGVLRHREMSLLGTQMEQIMGEYHVDMTFTGAFGVDGEHGLFGADVREAHTDRQLLQTATELVVLADSTKFASRGPVKLVAVEHIHCVVTDNDAPADQVRAFRAAGIEVVLA